MYNVKRWKVSYVEELRMRLLAVHDRLTHHVREGVGH